MPHPGLWRAAAPSRRVEGETPPAQWLERCRISASSKELPSNAEAVPLSL
jgi:hypothetical protein